MRGEPVGTLIASPAAVDEPDDLLDTARRLIDMDAAGIQDDSRFDVSCRAGCGACCNQAVPVTRSEVRAIRAYLRELPHDQRAQLEQRVAEVGTELAAAGVTATNVDDERAYFALGVACPFLVDGSCGIRPARPLACREYLVTSDPAHCATREDGKIVRISSTRDVIAGFGRVSAEFGEAENLTLAPAMAEADPPRPQVAAKSGPAMMRLLGDTGRSSKPPQDVVATS